MEKPFDVLTLEDIVDALQHDGGVMNTFVDCIRINHNFRRLVELECAESNKLICNLESPAEIY